MGRPPRVTSVVEVAQLTPSFWLDLLRKYLQCRVIIEIGDFAFSTDLELFLGSKSFHSPTSACAFKAEIHQRIY